MNWTIEQILGLAPDQFTLRAGRSLAEPQKWLALHHDGDVVWGIFPNGRHNTSETAVYLPTFSFICTCNSRKAPCRHSLALLQLWQQHAPNFTPQPPNPKLTAWSKREQIKQARANGRSQPNNLSQLKTGLDALELWLLDMVRHGLARLPERPKAYWDAMADRLIDAQAIPLAQTIRRLAQLPKTQPDWPEQLLQEIGRLYLIIQGFRQFEQLPVTTQADLQTAVGWLPTATENPPIHDTWLVLGRQQEPAGKHTRHTTWLWGQKSQNIAQLIEQTRSAVPEGRWLPTNTVWQGTLQRTPSGSPQIATRHGQLQEIDSPTIMPPSFGTIRDATQAYGRSLAANPWLADFPMLLQNVQPQPTESGWQLADPSGTLLPLPEKFSHGWHLLALAGGNFDLTIFGVWNGRFFHPLSVYAQQTWQDIHIWRGVQ
ncbi:MAG: hypothetical protein KC445_06430 [Anaerolineales bacterium]|nr:hypothetical protein [Anaerolineales bacterium]